MPEGSFFAELRKRKVVQTAAIYGAVAWGVTEVVVTIVEQLFLPQWVSTLAVIFFVVGFPVAMFLSWTFDFTSEGIRRTDVTSRKGTASIVASLLLLLTGTAGLFFLISPNLEVSEARLVAPEVAPNSIAVLPFANAGTKLQDAYLVDGLSDELRDQLGRVNGLRIAARSSSVAAIDQGMDALTASSTLGVANLIEGSVRSQGGLLRVSVQLVEGASGLAIWSQTFERGPRELLALQQEVVEAVVGHILPGGGEVTAEPATRSATANELMLLARHYELEVRDRQVVDVEKLLEAVRLYRQAIEADPESALAQSRLAGALLYLGDVNAAEAPIFKALSLNPNLSEVQNTMGEFYWARGTQDAVASFTRAVELNPNNADALQNLASSLQLTSASVDSGIEPAELYKRAVKLDPLSLSRHAALGDHLGKFGHEEEIPAVIREVEYLFESTESYRVIAWLHELIGELDRAIAWTISARNMEPDNPDHVAKLAELYAVIGDFDTALQLEPNPGIGMLFQMRRYEDLIDMAEFRMIEVPNDIEVRYLLAFAHVATSEFESAIHILESTGLPHNLLNGLPRSVSEIEAFTTLMNALAGAGTNETLELAESLARYQDELPWWGDVGWLGLFRGCSSAILMQHEQALQYLSRVTESPRLRREPLLHDSWCFRQYHNEPVYQRVLSDQENRRALLREQLPSTLAEFGVSL